MLRTALIVCGTTIDVVTILTIHYSVTVQYSTVPYRTGDAKPDKYYNTLFLAFNVPLKHIIYNFITVILKVSVKHISIIFSKDITNK